MAELLVFGRRQGVAAEEGKERSVVFRLQFLLVVLFPYHVSNAFSYLSYDLDRVTRGEHGGVLAQDALLLVYQPLAHGAPHSRLLAV